MALKSIQKYTSHYMTPENYPWVADMVRDVEREIAERYMEQPVDADGVPIRIGDTVIEVDDTVPCMVMSLHLYDDGCWRVNTYGLNTNLLRHVKPRTVEDVLEEFLIEFDDWDWNTGGNDRDNARKQLFAKYADELRSMGVGE